VYRERGGGKEKERVVVGGGGGEKEKGRGTWAAHGEEEVGILKKILVSVETFAVETKERGDKEMGKKKWGEKTWAADGEEAVCAWRPEH